MTGVPAIAQVLADEPILVVGQEFTEPLDLGYRVIDRPILFRDCVFQGLSFAGTRLVSLRLEGCTVRTVLDLARVQSQGDIIVLDSEVGAVDLRSGRIDGELILALGGTSAELDPDVACNGYRVHGDSLKVGGNARVAVATVPLEQALGPSRRPIRLRGCRIGLEGTIEGSFWGADYGGRSIFMGQSEVGDALTIQAETAGVIDLANSSFGSASLAHGTSQISKAMTVPKRTVALAPPGHSVSLTLKSTVVRQDLSLAGARLVGTLVLDSVHVHGDLHLRDDEATPAVEVLVPSDSADAVVVSLRSAVVEGTLAWFPTIAQSSGVIDFRNTSVGILDDTDQPPVTYTRLGNLRRDDSPAPEPAVRTPGFWHTTLGVRLDGFRYAAVAGISGESFGTDTVTSWVEKRLAWIRSGWASSEGARTIRSAAFSGFSTSPYIQLAEVLKKAGYRAAERDVLYCMRADAQRFGPRQSRIEFVVSAFLRYFVGWGYRPGRALAWGIGGFLLGAAVLSSLWRLGLLIDTQDQARLFNPFVLSLEYLIPAGIATQETYRLAIDGLAGWLGLAYIYVHHLLGWAIGIGLAYSAVDRIRGER